MNDSQNPNVNNQVTNNVNTPATNANVAPSVQSEVAINIGSEQVVTPSASAPVAPQPIPAESTPVEPIAPTQSTTADSPFFTPTSVQPETSSSLELPPVTPARVETPVSPTQTVAQPVQTVQPQAGAVATVEAAPESQVEVIETVQKSKTSNFIIIIFLILLILFVFNIDTVISIYDRYRNPVTPQTPTNKKTDNVTEGFVMINENTSSIKVNNIKFYNFRQAAGKGITFSYEVLAKIDNAKSLGIYIELYNSEKEIIYKELYNPSQKLEKDTVRTYIIEVEKDVYDAAFYALVKTYTEEEKAKKTSLTCSSEDKNYYYKHTYNFVNNGLSTYDVEKTSKKTEAVTPEEGTEENAPVITVDKKLQEEYELLKDTNNATLENGVLKFSVDVNADNDDFVVAFEANTTLKVIKDRLTEKEWKCE